MKQIKKWKGVLDLGQYNGVVSQFHRESDRAAAIIAVAFVDQYLQHALTAAMVKSPEIDELFDGHYAPLATFAAKSKLCFAMGLISKRFLYDLSVIRNVRNHFAHHPLETSFLNAEVNRLCLSLSIAKYFKDKESKPGQKYCARDIFLFAISAIVGKLEMRKHDKKQCVCLGE